MIAHPDWNIPEKELTEPLQSHHVLQCLSRAEALRDSATNLHEELVGVVVTAHCQALRFEPGHVEIISEAARLHDIGKFALPSDILHKPGPLSPEEWAFVRRHTEIGHGILRIEGNRLLDVAAALALNHHEHFDGSGYPQGLAGEAIPFEARIVGVADTYEALRADRAYKRGVGHEVAIATILDGDDRSKPSHFDPKVLLALEKAASVIANAYDRVLAIIPENRSLSLGRGGG